MIKIFWYITKTLNLDITFKFNLINDFIEYIDSDLDRFKDAKKSTIRYKFFLTRFIFY